MHNLIHVQLAKNLFIQRFDLEPARVQRDDNVCCAALARPSARPSLSVTTAVGKGGPQLARETGKIWNHDFPTSFEA